MCVSTKLRRKWMIDKDMREEKPDVQGRCHKAERGKFGEDWNISTENISVYFGSVGEHTTPTPPPLPSIKNIVSFMYNQ